MKILARAAAVVAVLAGAGLALRARADSGTQNAPPAAIGAPVVVELFSSEGCSSCPPADAFLLERSARPDAPIVALEYHVDYWDYLGWKDPFARHEFTERQEAYARNFGGGRMFTPEIVVQGRSVLPERSAKSLRDVVKREAAEQLAHVVVGLDGDVVTVHVDGAPKIANGDPLDVVLAVTESGLVSEVRAGENRGETLAHAPVVRRFSTIGQITSGTFDARVPANLSSAWDRKHLRLVILVQARSSRRIHGAGYR